MACIHSPRNVCRDAAMSPLRMAQNLLQSYEEREEALFVSARQPKAHS